MTFSKRLAVAALMTAAMAVLGANTARADIYWNAASSGGGTNSGSALGDVLSTNFALDGVAITLTGTRSDPYPSTLSTQTIDINNKSGTTRTLTFNFSSKDYTTAGSSLVLTCTAQGTSSNAVIGQTASTQTWVDNTNTLFGTPASGTAGVLSGAAVSSGATTYAFSYGGFCPPVSVPYLGNFSITQQIIITLAAGKEGQITLSSNVAAPEPSTLAIAGLGALGLIGVGLRRRRMA